MPCTTLLILRCGAKRSLVLRQAQDEGTHDINAVTYPPNAGNIYVLPVL